MAKMKQKVAMTLDGQQVWTNGKAKYWTGEQNPQVETGIGDRRWMATQTGMRASQILFYAEWPEGYLELQAAKIEAKIGQPVQWVDAEDAEVSSI